MLVEVYHSAENSTRRVQDQMLLSTAFGISENALNTQGDLLLLEVIQQTSDETVFYKVEGPDGAFVIGYSGLPRPPHDVAPAHREPYFFLGKYRNKRVRVVALRTLVEDPELSGWMTVYVAQPTEYRESLVWDEVVSSTIRLGLLVVIAGLLAWVAVSLGLRPLARLERAIGKRSYEDLSPIDVVIPKEVSNVEAALNSLLARLERSIGRNKRFVSNASHQLRTPVAALVAQTESALRETEEVPARGPVERIHANAVRMSRLIGQLLSLARADDFESTERAFEIVDLVKIARDTTSEQVPDAVAQGIDLGFNAEVATAEVLGNLTLLSELLRNLIDNACRYCPRGSEVTVRVAQEDGSIVIEVLDDGPGIPPQDHERVLERFTRLKDDNSEGSGLGLAIAVEVAQAHGGRLRLSTPPTGRGLKVQIAFPSATTEHPSRAGGKLVASLPP